MADFPDHRCYPSRDEHNYQDDPRQQCDHGRIDVDEFSFTALPERGQSHDKAADGDDCD